MTKNIFSTLTLVFAFVLLATTNASAQKSVAVNINTEKSSLGWLGKKVIGQHNGKVSLTSGTVFVNKGTLTGGEFVINMESITCDDIENPDYNKKLIGHFNSTDFFNVAEFPTAKLKITKVLANITKGSTAAPTNYTITADLTIKGITNSISFPATFKATGSSFEGNATFTIDRTLWDIKYGSSNFFEGLGDKAILNEIEFTVNLAS
jgi:polyisoprenoid-binding protein YceI